MTVDLRHGDNLKVLPTLADCSVDSIVTDPPYGLTFMGRAWDASVPVDIWAECLRVLRPGGHLLAFGGTRTAHRLAVAIEDAGFEIRDSITWLYGSGFPKSLDVSKAIDKARDEDAGPRADVCRALRAALDASGRTRREIDEHFGTANVSQYWFSPDRNAQVPPADRWPWLRDFLGLGPGLDAEVWRLNGRKGAPGDDFQFEGRTAEGVGFMRPDGRDGYNVTKNRLDRVGEPTDAAQQWQGWGTALKPASEPVIVARKPLQGTVAATVLAHGTGALNVDACRVAGNVPRTVQGQSQNAGQLYGADQRDQRVFEPNAAGRWPANVVLTHPEQCVDVCVDGCPVAELDAQSGITTNAAVTKRGGARTSRNDYRMRDQDAVPAYGDTGGASRYFPTFRYQAKAPTSERPKIDGQGWPTVKPLALMRWLVRLVTPPGGLVLDPFAGTGATLQAAELEGFDSLGVELDPHAYALACQRLGIETAA